jgi:autotransporter-associated beta strand protein
VAGNNGRGTSANLNDIRLTGTNTYTGSTYVNSGRLVLANTSDNGTTATATGTGDVTIAGGYSGNAGIAVDRLTRVVLEGNSQISNSATVNVMGAGTLDLNGFSQTLAGLSFNNHGGDAPTVAIGSGTLTLGGNITASGQNLATVSTISTTGIGQLSLGGTTRTITVNPVTWNSDTLSPYQPNLNISGVVTGTGAEGINKAGNGILQLSGQSTFTGGVDLQAGGLLIGGSSSPSAFGAGAITAGPLGTGSLTIGAGTFLLSSAAANTVLNDYTIGGNFSFRGTTALTLNGNTMLPSGATTITVDSPVTTYSASASALILGGVISGTDGTSAITKAGLGTLVLNNNNTFAGGITLNAGNLVLGGLPGTNNVSPLVSGSSVLVNSDQALLSFMNNGGGSGGVISYANDVQILGSLTQANLHAGNFTANTGNVVEVQNLNVTSGQTINISSSNSYNVRLLNVNTTGGSPVNLNVAGGTTVLVFNYGAQQPVNVGKGTLLFPDQPYINQTNTISGGTISLNGTYPIVPQFPTAGNVGTSAPTGYTAGGLSSAFYSMGAGNNLISTGASGIAPSGVLASVGTVGDTAFANRPLGVTSSTFTNGTNVMTGLIEITTAGTYTFATAVDDQSLLIINGQTIVGKNAAGGGTGIGDYLSTSAGTGSITLTAGFHTIVYKNGNTGSAGGYHLLYSGPDTNGNGLLPTTGAGTGGFQAIPANKLYANNSMPTAANNYLLAAQVTNNYVLGGTASITGETGVSGDAFITLAARPPPPWRRRPRSSSRRRRSRPRRRPRRRASRRCAWPRWRASRPRRRRRPRRLSARACGARRWRASRTRRAACRRPRRSAPRASPTS